MSDERLLRLQILVYCVKEYTLHKIPTYIELVHLTRNNPKAVELALAETHEEYGDEADALRMGNHHHPVSIKQCEARYINSFIKRHNLTAGYEVATAFGVSGLYAALAFKETGGLLVTMDSYIEEHFNEATAYSSANKGDYSPSADGKRSALFLADHFELPMSIKVGWSPDDVPDVMEDFSMYDTGIDYVFIDAMHNDDAVIADFDAIASHVCTGFAIFLHDTHCFTDKVQQHIRSKMKRGYKICDGCQIPRGYSLSIITDLE